MLSACDRQKQAEPINEDTLISRSVDSMLVITTENGKKTNLFSALVMEDYEFARVPFTEYRKGVEAIAYNDSTGVETSHIMSDYALHWTDRDLWELKGNVMVVGEEGRKLFSQQLTWDRKTKKIYSNVDSKVEEGDDVFIGDGFEADDDFSRWTFRRLTGRVSVDVEPSKPQDPAAANDSVKPAAPEPQALPQTNETPQSRRTGQAPEAERTPVPMRTVPKP